MLRIGYLIFMLVLTCAILSADIIYLKNGKKIECQEAWKEGKEVKYRISNGTVGLPRGMVSKIEKTAHSLTVQASGSVEMETSPFSPAASNPSGKQEKVAFFTQNGIKALEKRDYHAALENFQKAYELVKDENTSMNLAMTYFHLKDDWNADLHFNEVLRLNPQNCKALNLLGEIAWRKEDLTSAMGYWQRSLQIKQDPAIQEKLERLKREKQTSADYENESSRHFLIKYDGGKADSLLVNEILEYLEDLYQRLSRKLETYPGDPFIVVLYPQKDFFEATEAPFWSGGINDGKIKIPVQGVSHLTQEMKDVILHELVHSFVTFKTRGNCPGWLQEGLAQYMEGKSAEGNGTLALRVLQERNQLPPVSQLTDSFINADTYTAAVLYAISLSFTEFLMQKYPPYQMNEVLDYLGEGMSPAEAIESSYMLSLEQLETQWRQTLRN